MEEGGQKVLQCLKKSSMTLMVAVGRGFYLELLRHGDLQLLAWPLAALFMEVVLEAELMAGNLSRVLSLPGPSLMYLGHPWSLLVHLCAT